jgi:phosphoglycolate phosphatase-like HAD superfamily hydrolase
VLPLLQRARELGSLELVRQVESVLERAELAGALRCDVNAELVAWLRGLCYATPVAILSLNAVSAVERALTRAGVYGRISDVVARENVDRFKPDPQGLDILLERHRARPERSLFVGDSHRDAECAATAGVPYRDVREIGVSWVDPLTVCV